MKGASALLLMGIINHTQLYPLQPQPIAALDKSVHSFMKWYFENASCVTVITHNSSLSDLLLSTGFPLLFHSFQLFTDHRNLEISNEVSNNFLIATNEMDEIKSTLRRFSGYEFKSTTNFLIVSNARLQQVFAHSFAMKLKNLLILQMASLKVIYHNYYANHTNVFSISDVKEILAAFYAIDYNGFEIRGTLFENAPANIKLEDGAYMGIDYTVFKTIAEELNFTLSLHEPYDGQLYGSRDPDGTATGAIKELYEDQTDVACNQLFLKNYNAPELLFTSIVQRDLLCVVVPQAGRKPGWTAIFSTFSAAIWILIDTTLFAFICCLYLLRKVNITHHSRPSSLALLDVLQTVFNVSPSRYFNKALSEKIYLGLLLTFTLLITTSFQGSLVNVIRNPHRYKDINTLEELDQAGYPISTSSRSLIDTFSGSNHPYIQRLDKKLFLVPKGSPDYKGSLWRKTKFQYTEIMEQSRTGNYNLHLVKECPQTYMLTYLVHRDSMIYQDIRKMLDKFLAAGLPNKWYNDVIANLTLRYLQKLNTNTADHKKPIVFTLNNMQSSFYILIIGLTCSGVTFALETLRIL